MSGTLFPPKRIEPPTRWGPWVDRLSNFMIVLGLGVLLGSQYLEPNKRILSVAAAVILIGIAWRLDMVSGIGVMILALPYPRGTTFGSTNIALILLLVVIYLLRLGQREMPPPRRTPLDAPIGAFFLAYVVSFYNVSSAHDLTFALQAFELLCGTLIMFYLIVNSVRTEEELRRLHFFQTITLLGLMCVTVWELNNPGATLIPGWIHFESTRGDEFNRHNIRVGATFYDFELLADFCGLNLLFLVFQFARQADSYRRGLYAALLGLVLFIQFATVTRGPVFSLSAAGAYLLWRVRRHLRIVPLVIGGSLVAASVLGMNFFVTTYTHSGNLFARVGETKMVGIMPESRAQTWAEGWERMMQHPIIGWGPYYSSQRGLDFWYWPHNLYLYVGNLTGLVGLSFFLWLLFALWRVTRPRVDTLRSESYLDGYLLIANTQMVFFLVDQLKIEFLRNTTYQYQIWLMFALWVSAQRIRSDQLRASGIRP